MVSKVAPPQVSSAQKPTSSSISATGIMSSVRPRGEQRLVPSRSDRSMIFTGLAAFGRSLA